MNLIQLDGYNPLEITKKNYYVKKNKEFEKWITNLVNKKTSQKLLKSESFSPGEFIKNLESYVKIKNKDKLLKNLMSYLEEDENALIWEGSGMSP